MNIERLKALRNFEEALPIEMGYWLFNGDGQRIKELASVSCGTAGCHGGWTVVMLGLIVLPMHLDICNLVEEYYDIGAEEAEFLCTGKSHYFRDNECGEKEARARLDYLIEHGATPEDWHKWAKRFYHEVAPAIAAMEVPAHA